MHGRWVCCCYCCTLFVDFLFVLCLCVSFSGLCMVCVCIAWNKRFSYLSVQHAWLCVCFLACVFFLFNSPNKKDMYPFSHTYIPYIYTYISPYMQCNSRLPNCYSALSVSFFMNVLLSFLCVLCKCMLNVNAAHWSPKCKWKFVTIDLFRCFRNFVLSFPIDLSVLPLTEIATGRKEKLSVHQSHWKRFGRN